MRKELKEDLYKLYWIDGLSQKEIGKIYGKSASWIHCQMKKYTVPARNTGDIKTRFLYYVKIPENPNDCWEWKGGKNENGYGKFHFNGGLMSAHRVSYILYIGEFDRSLYCLHKCDNPECVNPEHLFLGNQNDNINDMKQKGRQREAKGEKNNRSKLTNEEVKEIKMLLLQGKTQVEIAKLFRTTQTNISYIKTGKLWKHIK